MIDETSLFRRYLLGELGESEQEAFERELMTSDEHFQELLIVEDEIVDDYCSGRLSASEEQKYRERFLVTPERRGQHRFGAALREHLSPSAEQKTPVVLPSRVREPLHRTWRLPLAAAAAAILVAGVWLLVSEQRSPVRLEETARRVEGSRVAFFLTTERLRSQPEREQALTVPVGVAFVELQLDLPAEARGEQDVALEDARSEVLAKGTLPAETLEGQSVVVATVPSELLVPGDYRVVLRDPSANGEGPVLGTYEFRVASR